MLSIFNRLKKELSTIDILQKVDRHSREKEISKLLYGATIQFNEINKYKGRKGKFKDLIFINLYSSDKKQGDLRAKDLQERVVKLLDEADLSNGNIKTYLVELRSMLEASWNEKLNAWQGVVTLEVRWSDGVS
ncbi:hypothetical protein [Halonatronum saccharophilum]|uniref:hypothetical protein n=1 Tax=Halonatronum saccharophilum TaxID=150060 RepID=UPI000488798F|nr:hypothetical protein [Halonatronum saccharophilum]